MAMIRLKNREPRMFATDLECYPEGEKRTFRRVHNRKTGEVGIKEVTYPMYQVLTIPPRGLSEPLDEKVLECAGVQGAIRSKWLRVIKV